MSKYIPDISSRRWVIISQQRANRPGSSRSKKNKICPFKPGHESMTPPETFRLGKGEPNKPGWTVRVIPNKYPITDIHEVIIHSPDCVKDMEELPQSQIELIIRTYRERFNFYKKQGQVIIFCNFGEYAGASINHPHSQLVVIPSQINLDTLLREPLNNMVDEDSNFSVYCPDFSQWPYETWIVPKIEGSVFGDIKDPEINDLSKILQKIIKRMKHIYNESTFPNRSFAYNYYIYPKENWYIRIIPRFIHRAGFELGTGLSVNLIDPIDAALELRGYDKRVHNVLQKLKKHSSR